ncbi:MAG TPA: SCO family protein [Castellaniella sp.]|uniref:SCO family protein n=1 Tax=Castellaniella sp. TaxID=1955812 RepID=UPI002EF7DD73
MAVYSSTRRSLLVAAIASLPLALAGCGDKADSKPLAFEGGNDITGTHLGSDLDMVSTDGQARTLASFRGKVLLVYFGYTHCPDVCPTSMAMAAQALALLGPKAKDVQVAMVTVDPQRDTPKVLAAYVQAFNPTFVGLTGTADQLARTARSFKVSYAKEAGPTPQQYAMSHSSAFYLIDRKGETRALISANTTPQDMAHDIQLLL